LGSPAFSGFFIDEIKIDTVTRPAFANKRFTILVLDIKFFSLGFSVYMVGFISLNVRVSNSNKVTTIFNKGIDHSWDIRVEIFIPSEISAAISVIDIKSDGITWDFMFIEFLVHMKDILLVNVRPSALVVTKSEELWHGTVSKDIGSGLEMRGIIMADKDVAFKITSFTEPEGISSRAFSVDIDISIRGVLPVHGDKTWGVFLSADNDGNGSIKGVFGANWISRDILIIESVRKIFLGVFKKKISSSFRKSIEKFGIEGEVAGEIFIESERFVSVDFEKDFFSVVSGRV